MGFTSTQCFVTRYIGTTALHFICMPGQTHEEVTQICSLEMDTAQLTKQRRSKSYAPNAMELLLSVTRILTPV